MPSSPDPIAPGDSDHPPDAPPPTWRERIALAWFRVTGRMYVGITSAYLGAASLIGVEALAFLLTFTSAWPIAIPFAVGTLAAVFFFRERLRALWRCLRHRD